MSCWTVLEINPTKDLREIKKAYSRLRFRNKYFLTCGLYLSKTDCSKLCFSCPLFCSFSKLGSFKLENTMKLNWVSNLKF